jgi:tetratricopeptide (TPR) repeat protein
MNRVFRLVLALWLTAPLLAQASSAKELRSIASAWDRIHYQRDKPHRAEAYEGLLQQLSASKGDREQAGLLLWEAIIRASLAGEKGALGGALDYVKQAKILLERAEAMGPGPETAGIYTTLGSLYYQVPGWPLGYGDKAKARRYLEKALQREPQDIDANYFYGDFLLQEEEYRAAAEALNKAQSAPKRPGREVGDAGRRQEIGLLLVKIREEKKDAADWAAR